MSNAISVNSFLLDGLFQVLNFQGLNCDVFGERYFQNMYV